MSFSFESEDGILDVRKSVALKNLATLETGCPRQGTKCSFKILSITNFSTGQTQTDEGIPLSASNYCPALNLRSTDDVTATIGLTSTSEFDRLLEVCLTRLHVGEKAEFDVKCSRSKSSYSLTLELATIEESPELHELNAEAILEIASSLKKEGVRLFTEGFIIDAFYKFQQAMKYLCLLPPSERDAHHTNFISTLQSNMASCHVKLGNWEETIDLCDSVLETDSVNIKALYRRGWSYIEMQEYERAGDDLHKAKQLDPENKAVKVKLAVLVEKEKALNAKYAKAMKKFFS